MGNFSYKLSVGSFQLLVGSFQLLVGSFQLPFCFSTTKYHKGVSQSLTKKLFRSSQSLVSQSLASKSLASQSLVSQSLVSQRLVSQRLVSQRLASKNLLRSCVLTCLTVFLSFFATAQDFAPLPQSYVSYEYDASGNRINRTIHMKMLMPPPQDSTEIVVEDEEDTFTSVQDMENGDQAPQETYNEEETYQEKYTDALSETLITIYPNPTRGLLTVKMSNMPQHSTSSLTLFDMQGRVITQQQTLSEENKLDISTQPAGTYVMRIAVGEEQVSWKIVKQ